MKKSRIISGILLFISAAAVLLYGTGPVTGLMKKTGFMGEDGKILMRLEDEKISASVQKNFTVPLGGEGMLLVEYVRKRGTADISITKNGQEVAGMGIERPEHPDGGSGVGAEPGKRGELKTVLGSGIYTIRVEAGEYGGVIACSLLRKDQSDMP